MSNLYQFARNCSTKYHFTCNLFFTKKRWSGQFQTGVTQQRDIHPKAYTYTKLLLLFFPAMHIIPNFLKLPTCDSFSQSGSHTYIQLAKLCRTSCYFSVWKNSNIQVELLLRHTQLQIILRIFTKCTFVKSHKQFNSW